MSPGRVRPSADPRRGRAAALALVLCAMTLCGSLTVYVQFFHVYSVVDLRVNPAFAIELNRRNQIRGVAALTAEATSTPRRTRWTWP